jgi:hypothetical protein
VTTFPDGFFDVDIAYTERFGDGIPTMLIDPSRFAEAMDIAKRCLENGEDTLLAYFGLDKLDPNTFYA